MTRAAASRRAFAGRRRSGGRGGTTCPPAPYTTQRRYSPAAMPPRGGKARHAGYDARAGDYVVITSPETKQEYVYMHLESAPLVRTGEQIGTRWHAGGEAVDPFGQLRAWDGWS